MPIRNVTKLQKQNAEFKAKNASLEDQTMTLQSQIVTLRGMIKAKERDNAVLSEDLDIFKYRMTEAEAHVNRLKAQLSSEMDRNERLTRLLCNVSNATNLIVGLLES